MTWFLFALASPAIWAAANYVDKHLVDRYFLGVSAGPLLVFASLTGIFVLPVIYFIEPGVFGVPWFLRGVLVFEGILSGLALLFYFKAFQGDEASVVVPLFQLIPVFVFLFGYFGLGETITFLQGMGSLLIMLGAIGLTSEIGTSRFRVRWRTLLLMTAASVLLAFGNLLYKVVAIDYSFWPSMFWEYVGSVLLAPLLLVVPAYFRGFRNVVRTRLAPVISLNVLNEAISAGAILSFRYAQLLAPIVLVQVVNGFQPLFILLYGIFLTLFFPHFAKEDISAKRLLQKALFIAIIFIGTMLLF